jgi:hypothetical protein
MNMKKTLVLGVAAAALLGGHATAARATAPGCSIGAYIPNDTGNIVAGGWATCTTSKPQFCYQTYLQIPGSLGSWVNVGSSGKWCDGFLPANTTVTRTWTFPYQGCTSYRSVFWTSITNSAGTYYEQQISASRWICH